MGIKTYKKLTGSQGFTIIEVMIVLAIAGVIMVIVFLAVPELQRSTRDTERKQYAREVFSQMLEYYSNNGHYPRPDVIGERQKFIDNYMPQDKDPLTGILYTDPSAVTYFAVDVDHSAMPKPGQVFIAPAHYCTSSEPGSASNPTDPISGHDVNENLFVIWIGLERGGYYCVDSYLTKI